MAVGRINMEANGTGTCEADGECRAKQEPEKPDSVSVSTTSTEAARTGFDCRHSSLLFFSPLLMTRPLMAKAGI